MFQIKRGTEYFREIKSHAFNGELIQTVAWVTDKNKAATFTTPLAAEVTLQAMGYKDAVVVE